MKRIIVPGLGIYHVPGGDPPELKTADPPACEHAQFKSVVRVARLTDGDNGPVTGYGADIRITCAICDLPFRFIGLKAGYNSIEPMCSIDGQELRAPIEPAIEASVKGVN